ncbi:hypothetical protein A5N15_06475 [Rothia kristinae]|uniref:Uncharacterized protein n=1 Tax=Rothia kristinae TaxID=37923 RepID=A0A657IUP5_9MICC|nr:hypothetical protein A5N15_06475 [Rothia kristinae]
MQPGPLDRLGEVLQVQLLGETTTRTADMLASSSNAQPPGRAAPKCVVHRDRGPERPLGGLQGEASPRHGLAQGAQGRFGRNSAASITAVPAGASASMRRVIPPLEATA